MIDPASSAASDWTGQPVTERELEALRAMRDRPAAPPPGVGCFYCPKHPQATTYVHDARGCLPVCQKHYAWRMQQSIISGHSEGCRERMPESSSAARQEPGTSAFGWTSGRKRGTPSGRVHSVQRSMTLDLYVAVVGTSDGFDEWYDRKGFADAWSALCVKVQGVFRDCPGH